MRILEIQLECSCGHKFSLNWTYIQPNIWNDVETCECCGTSVRTFVDATCPQCGKTEDIQIQ